MNNILDMFDSVEITNKNVISEEDRAYCEAHFNFYTRVYNTYQHNLDNVAKLIAEQEEIKNLTKTTMGYPANYISPYLGIGESVTKKAMVELTTEFISAVCEYFNKKYSITSNAKALNFDMDGREPKYFTLDDIIDNCILGSLDDLSIANKAHKNQVDKAGKPYVEHIIAVAERVEDNNDKIVAFLHDVIEDSDYTLDFLRKIGFNEDIVKSVECITKIKNEPYEKYLERIKLNPRATRVKIADLNHNMDLNRLAVITDKDEKRLEKYKKAVEYLMNIT